eukprot:TRINITY_DN100947_c0_g1_i1.p1 TRINITY_DN100947_c0_g1~~TRINITY_DN100947_c0_g1_i1.p1  ORF type:complete len:633 (+),score=175.17 TRINITY_DN100947_c0_g1_i1:84-1982(+)
MAANQEEVKPVEVDAGAEASPASAAATASPASAITDAKSSPAVFKYIKSGSKSSSLRWTNLGFSVAAKKGERKQILREITGGLVPGELTCLLGPSGSGKTSCLNILAGRVRPGGKSSATIDGSIFVNGNEIKPSDSQHLFGYVMQDDAILGTMTPREVLSFAANLRLRNVDKSSLDELLTDMLSSLGLTKCADTMVGNELIKGISGGERKRTAVGAELITNPAITFLDEPTSGLDTAAAYTVISVLKELTKLQQSVLCTIHQPSSELFHLFDKAIFLAQGRVMYHGAPSGIRAYFDGIGHNCPMDYNPSDFVMFLVQTSGDSVIESLAGAWKKAISDVATENAGQNGDSAMPARVPRKGFATEFVVLCKRELLQTVRDKGTLGARFGSTIFLTVIYSLVFFRIGSEDVDESVFVDRDAYDMQSHAGALTMLGISGMFGSAQPLLLTFASERPVFMREKAANMYGTAPYFLSKTLVELPLLVLQNTVMWLIAYWMMAMKGNFLFHIAGTTMVSAAAASMALLAGCIVADAKQAMEAAPGLFVPQILFAGFFIKMELIPPFMRWLQYVCSLKWGMNILLINEFEDSPMSERVIEANDADADHVAFYYLVLLGLSVLFRGLAMIALSRKAKAFYN